jgi:ABC-type transport system involved in multi-copper enzyme maturation permease subunit
MSGTVSLLPLHYGTLLVLACAISLLGVLRALAPRMLGPVFSFELTHSARRGWVFGLRFFYVGIVFVILLAQFRSLFPDTNLLEVFGANSLNNQQRALFAGSFFNWLLALQFIGLMILTPIFAASAIPDERRRRSLDLLLTTSLRDREIVLGLVAARLANMALLAFTVVPVLAMLFLLGGVNADDLMIALTVDGFAFLSLGALSAFVSVRVTTSAAAIAMTMFMALLFFFLTCIQYFWWANPIFGFVLASDAARSAAAASGTCAEILATYSSTHVVLALICAALAVRQLRRVAAGNHTGFFQNTWNALVGAQDAQNMKAGTAQIGNPSASTKASAVRRKTWWARHQVDRSLPPIGDRPLLWKEFQTGPNRVDTPMRTWVRLWKWFLGPCLGLAAFLAFLVYNGSRNFTWTVTGIGTLVAYLAILGAAVISSVMVSWERTQRTLEGLLLLPISDQAILGAKWLAAWIQVVPIALLATLDWILGVAAGAYHWSAVVLQSLAVCVYITFAVSVGMWFSTICRSVPRAMVYSALAMALILVGPGVFMGDVPTRGVWPFWPRVPVPTWWEIFPYYGLTPWAALDVFLYTPNDPRHSPPGFMQQRVIAALAGLVFYLAASGLLWLAAVRCLRRNLV